MIIGRNVKVTPQVAYTYERMGKAFDSPETLLADTFERKPYDEAAQDPSLKVRVTRVPGQLNRPEALELSLGLGLKTAATAAAGLGLGAVALTIATGALREIFPILQMGSPPPSLGSALAVVGKFAVGIGAATTAVAYGQQELDCRKVRGRNGFLYQPEPSKLAIASASGKPAPDIQTFDFTR